LIIVTVSGTPGVTSLVFNFRSGVDVFDMTDNYCECESCVMTMATDVGRCSFVLAKATKISSCKSGHANPHLMYIFILIHIFKKYYMFTNQVYNIQQQYIKYIIYHYFGKAAQFLISIAIFNLSNAFFLVFRFGFLKKTNFRSLACTFGGAQR
jgi:hypothetical protein